MLCRMTMDQKNNIDNDIGPGYVPDVPLSLFRCVRFYYYLSGMSDTAVLRAYVRDTEDGSGVSLDMPKDLVAELQESQGERWIHIQRPVTLTRNFQV